IGQEATGSYVMPGEAVGETATAIEAAQRSMNIRVAEYQKSKAEWRRELLEIAHALNRRYIDGDQVYRVINRDAADLPGYSDRASITPEEMDVDVDFHFDGLKHQRQTGLETVALERFIQLMTYIIQVKPELASQVDWEKLAVYAQRGVLGFTPDDPVMRSSIEEAPAVPPQMENGLVARGKPVAVHPKDDTAEHGRVHLEFLMSQGDSMPEDAREALVQHIMEHYMRDESDRVNGSGAQLAPPQQQGAPSVMGQGSAPVLDPMASQSPQGVTPGPPNLARQRKIGRKITPSQTGG
ncbi:MAG TPA: hypothetical protein PKA88_29975, partial [Polyangiaceae bacterium]|nr:hypothetical protein [Polyangiaceae bacterium]